MLFIAGYDSNIQYKSVLPKYQPKSDSAKAGDPKKLKADC
jgi:hypothetical protein